MTLQPGERRTVTFQLTPEDLSLWNPEMKRVEEPGTFTISSGPNSVDLKSRDADRQPLGAGQILSSSAA